MHEKKKKGIFSKILSIVFTIILIGWVLIVLYDFYLTKQNKEPKFCLKNEVTEYSDGNVYTCTGLGYKVIRYDREVFNAIEFGPFWTKDQTIDK